MIDPQLALAQAIAHSRAQQVIQPLPNVTPHGIHQMAASLATRLAGSRAPLGQATVQMFPQAPQPQQPQQPQVGYAPNGNPQDYASSGVVDNGDSGFFVHPLFNFSHPGVFGPGGRVSGYL